MIRTYYWHDRVVGRLGHGVLAMVGRTPDRYFKIGNAGDIFVKDVLESQYGVKTSNVVNEGRRILSIGSVAHKLMPGDIACGIGSKTPELPVRPNSDVILLGLRGPLTYEAFRRAGHDLSNVKFLLDPGLLIRRFVDTRQRPMPGKIGFVAHYRERSYYRKRIQHSIKLIDIDDSPISVAKQILSCELIYSSSLHGIIFAHALQRPCIFVRPRTEEPLFKYQDYYASVGLPMPNPVDDIERFHNNLSPTSPANVNFSDDDFEFPSVDYLTQAGVATTSKWYDFR